MRIVGIQLKLEVTAWYDQDESVWTPAGNNTRYTARPVKYAYGSLIFMDRYYQFIMGFWHLPTDNHQGCSLTPRQSYDCPNASETSFNTNYCIFLFSSFILFLLHMFHMALWDSYHCILCCSFKLNDWNKLITYHNVICVSEVKTVDSGNGLFGPNPLLKPIMMFSGTPGTILSYSEQINHILLIYCVWKER